MLPWERPGFDLSRRSYQQISPSSPSARPAQPPTLPRSVNEYRAILGLSLGHQRWGLFPSTTTGGMTGGLSTYDPGSAGRTRVDSFNGTSVQVGKISFSNWKYVFAICERANQRSGHKCCCCGSCSNSHCKEEVGWPSATEISIIVPTFQYLHYCALCIFTTGKHVNYGGEYGLESLQIFIFMDLKRPLNWVKIK